MLDHLPDKLVLVDYGFQAQKTTVTEHGTFFHYLFYFKMNIIFISNTMINSFFIDDDSQGNLISNTQRSRVNLNNADPLIPINACFTILDCMHVLAG